MLGDRTKSPQRGNGAPAFSDDQRAIVEGAREPKIEGALIIHRRCRSFVHKKIDYGQKAVVSDLLGSSNKIFSTLSTRSPGPEWQVRAASWRAL